MPAATRALAIAAGRLGSAVSIGLFSAIAVFAAERGTLPRDPGMLRIVTEFDVAAAGVPRQFRADVMKARARCGKSCDWEAFAPALADMVTRAEKELSAALKTADRRLKERAGTLKGADSVLGAAGDLDRGVERLEMISLRASNEMTESLAPPGGSHSGGEPLLTTLQLRLASLVFITPIQLRAILTVHVAGKPTAWVHIDGSAPAGSTVTVVIACGGAKTTLQAVTDDDGRWGVSGTVALSGSTTCAVTATGTGIGTGSVTAEIHFP